MELLKEVDEDCRRGGRATDFVEKDTDNIDAGDGSAAEGRDSFKRRASLIRLRYLRPAYGKVRCTLMPRRATVVLY